MRAYEKAKAVNPNPSGVRTAEQRAILFGQNLEVRAKRGALTLRLLVVAAGTTAEDYARCGIFGRSPLALPVIGGFGSRVLPGSITKVWSSEYHGPVTSGAGALPSWRT